ncbi:unnamed protein product [Orchesella dallaii]|uniref:Uncharacterized protein n=1 Tax=Orchesella dallaii TaxID=48710 RepID=A0ABP1Q1X8_9HEXA
MTRYFFLLSLLLFGTVSFSGSKPIPDKEFEVTHDEEFKKLPILSSDRGETWPNLEFIVSTSKVQEGVQSPENAELEIKSFWRNFGTPFLEVSNVENTVHNQEAEANVEAFDAEEVEAVANVEVDDADNFEVETFVAPNSESAAAEEDDEEDLPDFRTYGYAVNSQSESKTHLNPQELDKYSYIPSTFQKPSQSTYSSSFDDAPAHPTYPNAPNAYSPGSVRTPDTPLIYNSPVTVPVNPPSKQITYLAYPNKTPIYIIPTPQSSTGRISSGSRYPQTTPYLGGIIPSGNSNYVLTPNYRQSSSTITNPGAPTQYYVQQVPEQQPTYVVSTKYPGIYKVSSQPQTILTYPMVSSATYP